MNFFGLVFCGILLIPGIVRSCPTSLEGWTFQFNSGEDVFITGLSSVNKCKQECLKSETCLGYTFQMSPPLNFCFLFSDVSTLTYCEGDCLTATVTRVVSDSSCPNDNEDLITSVETNSADECLSLCEDDSTCTHFTWLDENSLFPNTCFLYRAECDGTTPCISCQSGVLQCIYPTPPECTSYLELNDETRGVHGKTDDLMYCDGVDVSPSPDWQGGDKWYRMMPPAGTVIPEFIPKEGDCGTNATGWLNGKHPEHAGTNTESTVSFNYLDTPCWGYEQVSITNCGGFFVYKLPEVPFCNFRYCAVNYL